MGPQWAGSNLVPMIIDAFGKNSYLNRITAMKTIQSCSGGNKKALVEPLLGILAKALNDDVPNVRINACKAAAAASECIDTSSNILSICENLAQNDKDADVKYFAKVAYDTIRD